MKKFQLVLFSILFISTISLTGCSKGKTSNNIVNKSKIVQVIEFMYNSDGNPKTEVSNQAINNINITPELLAQIPLQYKDNKYTEEERKLYARQGAAMQPVIKFTDDFITILYNINPMNVEQQTKKLASNSIDQVKPEYDNVVSQIKQRNITRKYKSHKINRIVPIDAKITATEEVVPGRITSVTVAYIGKDGKEQENDIDLYIINLDGTWKLSRFKM